jgi:hypothetical protein
MASHKHGTMDVSAQERTFAGFLKVCVGVFTVSAAILIFLGFVGT